METLLLTLAWRFALMGLVAIGGANAVVPEMQRQVVEVQHWMSASDFSALFAIANAAPGPNVLIVTLVGWRVAGIPGALVTSASMMGPTSLITFWVFRIWNRMKDAAWRRPVQNGLSVVTVGLVAATGYILARASDSSLPLLAVTIGTAALSYKTKLNPLWAFAAAALLGVFGLT